MATIDHISPSMLGLFCRCQEAFRRRYVEGDRIPPGIAACIGTGMHKGAEANHRHKMASGVDLPLEDIQDAASDGYAAAVSGGVFFPAGEEGGARAELGKGRDLAVRLAAAYAAHVAPRIRPVAVEARMTAVVDGLSVPLLGVIDVLDASGWCPDLKSAAKKWARGKESASLQPAIYAWLLRRERGIDARISFEVLTHTGEHQSIVVETDYDALAPVVARAHGLLDSVRRGRFLPAEPGHWMCGPKWCGYWWSCPYISNAKKHRIAA